MTRRGRAVVVGVIVVLVVVAGVAAAQALRQGPPTAGPTSTGTATRTPTPTATVTPTPTRSATPTASPTEPADPLAGWTLEQKVGQLFMVGVDLTKPQQVAYRAVRDDHVGNVFLHGRTTAGLGPTRTLVRSMTSLVSPETTHGTRMFVATDQEGGLVQALQGPGFARIPDAMTQAGWSTPTLRSRAATWGGQLAAAGVNLDLAPVMDLVPGAAAAATNPPVGQLHRNYGYTPASVTGSANAFSAGLRSEGVGVAVKHFPGLGRVTGNTDTTAGVTDGVTTRHGASVDVFRSGIDAGAELVMVSTAVYSRIDGSRPAAFSPVVVTDMLRGDLGFRGLVITDDLSAAAQVEAWTPGERAVQAIDAGVDLVLVSKDPSVTHAAVQAVLGRARSDAAFAAKVDAAAHAVVAAKS
ncbi:glycoside hydrolase family 3 N-terminal domain-containing protein [Cellulomonas alba]|uniref:Glycoside hydrolase family 3 N-terminal domain-containing protein n=1 Tax=Cellulomonas alba TaxID=3053467 RepID=A0ABT7SIQ8_9CELL|nr:glycoside hydrolase family 3 N-terminal domain-containing protein [Cellulomonas alba]MDM7856036.1 glycoside hydrolase family 3 N-terminal domain-containing protein [Cellulomonas alba]